MTDREPPYVIEQTLIKEEDIVRRVEGLGAEISRDYAGQSLLLVGVLKGAFVFLADLARAIDDVHLQFDFMAVSSYGRSTETSGVLRILKDLDEAIETTHVLLVEDIVDTGLTLKYLVDNLSGRDPASLRTCVLLNKQERRQVETDVDYVGFHIDDHFVVGYGLDAAGFGRGRTDIAAIRMREEA